MQLFPIRKIGSGTYGNVYLVETREGEKTTCALKIFSVLHRGTTCSGLVREFVCANSIPPHPHVCRALRTWIVDEKAYLLMPYYGENAMTRMRRAPFQRLDDIVRIMIDLVSGISHMHAQGWMHRDIKPENVFLSSTGAVIGDFSLARFGAVSDPTTTHDKSGTASTEVCTLWTRAPELVNADLKGFRAVQEYGAEVDTFSLGAVGLALACGDYLLGRTRSENASDPSSYLESCVDVIGVTKRVCTLYNVSGPLFETAVTRIMPHVTKALRPDIQPFLELMCEMAHLDPQERPLLKDVAKRLEKMPHSAHVLRTEISSKPSPCMLPPILVPDKSSSELTRRIATSISVWQKGSHDGIPYTLLCQGLHFAKFKHDADTIIFILSQLRRFPEKRILKPIQLARCDVVTNYDLELVARRMLIAGPFMACAFACEFVLGDVPLEDLEKRILVSEFPSIAMETSVPFFDAMTGHWTSQQSLRSTLLKLTN